LSEDVVIRELLGLAELSAVYPLVHQLNPEVDEPLFLIRLEAMLKEGGYRCIAAYRDGAMIGVAGFWIGTQLWCGRFVEPDNVVVDRTHRNGGIGAVMMQWIETEAIRLGCDMMKLEAYAERHRTREFYRRAGFGEPGVVMVKTLPKPGAQTLEDILAKGVSSV
jgi:GNAT superfamily N-acetyltransferase